MPSYLAKSMLKDLVPTISVGILSGNLLSIGSEVESMEQAGVGLIHFDIMDGCFIPMMTVGPTVVKAIKTSMLKDVHLMIEDPINKIHDYAEAGADIITVHLESTRHIHRALQLLGTMQNVNEDNRGIMRGIAVNPGTPIENIWPLIDEVDMVTILAINPGWGGQGFIESTKKRILLAKSIIEESGRDILLMIDGGVSKKNIDSVAKMGADIIVTGSAVFDGTEPIENARFMLNVVRHAADV